MDTAMPAPPTAATPVPDSRGLNLFRADPYAAALSRLYLLAALHAHLLPHLDRLGALAGGRMDELAADADRHPPTLSVRNRAGADESRIDKHPAYVELERLAYSEFGLAALSHRGGALGWPEPMPAAAKYALSHLFVQAEFGLCCPVSMTDSLARTLRVRRAGTRRQVLPQVTSLDFDSLRQGAMFMTEQGAGSDVSATEVVAEARPDGSWRLSGDKWFCSNPDAGFAMVLARSETQPGLKGVSLFLLPRELDDGSRNRYRILRLKDKLGTRSMASGEIRLEGATAWLVGARRGFKQMADMINNSRLSNGMRAAGLMRRAVTEAVTSQQRRAFGQRLIDMPLMRRQLAKMTVWAEQARSVMFQTAHALAEADQGRADPALARILTPLIKFRACRDARKVTGDAMEARRLRLHRGMDRAAPGARRAPGLDLGRHQQHRRAGRAARHQPRKLAAGPAPPRRPAAGRRRALHGRAGRHAAGRHRAQLRVRRHGGRGQPRGTGAAGGDAAVSRRVHRRPAPGSPRAGPGNARGPGRPGVAASPGRARPVFGARERKRRLRRHPAIRAVAPRAHDAGGTAGAPPQWRQP